MVSRALHDRLSRAYRAALLAADWLLEPIDYVGRALNDRRDYPPRRLRRQVGPLRTFESSGGEFVAYLKLLCGWHPNERMLDIGCGCGLLVPHLAPMLASGARYTGVDIHAPSIAWCERRLRAAYPECAFVHLDIANALYNPIGAIPAATARFPFADEAFSLIVLKSVFTHMRPGDAAHYLSEIARMLARTNGRCLASAFLLNDRQHELAAMGRNQQDFAFGDDAWRYRSEADPEAAVAFRESYLVQLAAEQGLRVDAIHYGTWSGRVDGLSYQDLVLLRPARVRH